MNRTITISVAFNAIHQHEGLAPHGHRFTVAATFAVGAVSDNAPLMPALIAIQSELHMRSVGQMLPGIDQAPVGIAAWAFERLAGQFKSLESVTVTEDGDGLSGTVSRSR